MARATIAMLVAATEPASSLFHEERALDELIELATSRGIDLVALADASGVEVADLTSEQIVGAIQARVLNATSKSCQGCWIR